MISNSAYYEHLTNSLLDLSNKRASMEANFNRSMRSEYDHICELQIKDAVELVKMGVEYRECEGDEIVITLADTETISVSKKEIIDYIGLERYNQIFPERVTADDTVIGPGYEEEQSRQAPGYNGFSGGYQGNQSQDGGLNAAASLFMPLIMQMNQMYTETPIREEMRYYRDKTETLTKEKERISRECDDARAEVNRLRSLKEDLEKVNGERGATISTQAKEIEELKRSLTRAEQELTWRTSSIPTSGNESMTAEIERLKQRNAELECEVSQGGKATVIEELQSRNEQLQEQNNKLQDQNNKLGAENNALKEQNETLQRQRADAEKDAQEKLKKCEMAANEKADRQDKVIRDIEKDRDRLRSKLNEARRLESESQESRKILEDKLSQLEIDSESRIKDLEKKLEAKEEEERLLTERLTDLQQEYDSEKEMFETKTEEFDKLAANAIEDAEKAEQCEKLREEIEYLKEENEALLRLGFHDDKFDAWNETALNKDLEKSVPDEDHTIVFTDICDLAGYSEEDGDTEIFNVTKLLKESFDADRVYHIRGGRFGIISVMPLKETNQMMDEIVSYAIRELEIPIVYGSDTLVDKDPYVAKHTAYRQMNDALNNYKRKLADAEEMEDMETEIEEESEPVNPNIYNIHDYDSYNSDLDDDSSLLEEDTTTVDYGSKIVAETGYL